ncbi:MAG TPA: type II toxin-antitoxin system VapC family toxin, partial [Oscillatoriaceae cyanobacterium]
RLLLDTHVLLWALGEVRQLRPEVREAIADGRNVVYVSAASVWEAAIKRQLGKLEAPGDLVEAIAQCRLQPLTITMAHAQHAAELPMVHQDPFDRMLVAQAQLEGLTLVTRDSRLRG